MAYDRTAPHREYFYEIAQIPHGSKNEEALSNYLVNFAVEHNLEHYQDDMWNVVIRKPASAGCEGAPILTIQAHMDMVCEKNKNSTHNFETDPLEFVTEGNILRANHTTLGADDCTGVAYMLAILSDDSLKHPPLECIFTTQEEIGMFGAMALSAEEIRGRRMISLDGGGETNTLLTSAGGCQVNVKKKIEKEANEKACYKVSVRGLSGGHSGGEIHKEKGNANQILMRILKECEESGISLNLISFEGGLKDNAIPRESDAVISADAGREALEKQIRHTEGDVKEELKFSDGGFYVEIEEAQKAEEAMTIETTREIIDMMFLMPNGFIARSMAIEGLTMTSLNIGIVNTFEDSFEAVISVRSMLQSAIDSLVLKIKTVSGIFKASVSCSANYPGWAYNPVSPLRDVMKEAVKDLYDRELQLTAAHGGCECGVFSEKNPGMDIVTLGPITRYIHTPDEELDLESFDRTYKLLAHVTELCADTEK